MNYDEAKNFLYNGDGTTPNENMERSNKLSDLYMAVTYDRIQVGLQLIKELTSCDEDTAKLLWVDIKRDFGTVENNAILQAREKTKAENLIREYQYLNNAECPYCHSKNTKKISGLSKACSVAVFGVFAVGKVSKQWHCKNCNSDF